MKSPHERGRVVARPRSSRPRLALRGLSFWVWTLAVGCAALPESEARKPVAPATPVATAERVLAAIRSRDAEALASFVHPELGVRFSPSAFVDVAEDQVFSTVQVRQLWRDRESYRWGFAEGSGAPIDLVPSEYISRYVLAGEQDFAGAAVSINADESIGTTVNNTAKVYPGATSIEYRTIPSGSAADALDAIALRLVLMPRDGRWWLVGIIHDAWSP